MFCEEWQVPVLICVFTFVSCYFSLWYLISNAETVLCCAEYNH
jgi:hypothetical protein